MGRRRLCTARHIRGICVAAFPVLLLVTGCGGGSSSRPTALPSPPASTNTVSQAHHPPPVGECHLIGHAVLAGAVDHAHAVPCSRRHNAETAGIHPVYSKITRAVRDGYIGDCFTDAGN